MQKSFEDATFALKARRLQAALPRSPRSRLPTLANPDVHYRA